MYWLGIAVPSFLLAALLLYLEIKSKDGASSRRKRTAQTPSGPGPARPASISRPTDTADNNPTTTTAGEVGRPWPLCLKGSWDWPPLSSLPASGLWELADCRGWGFVCCRGSPKALEEHGCPSHGSGLRLSSEGFCFCSERGFGDMTCLQSLGEIRGECWQESSPSAKEVSKARF